MEHRGLERRLEALAERIAALRQAMNGSTGAARIEAFGEIEELERRYDTLAGRLKALDREPPGFRRDAKAELEKVADDLTGAIEEFGLWVDSGYQRRRPPSSGQR